MKDIYNLFEKPKNPLNYVAVRIGLASPDKIRTGHTAKSRSRRPSTTGPSSLKKMVYSAPRSSVL